MQNVLAALSLVFLFSTSYLSWSLIQTGEEDYGARYYFQKGEPILLQDAKLRDQFPGDESLYVLFEGTKLFEDDFLKKLDVLKERLLENEIVLDVKTLSTVDHIEMAEDGFDIRPVVDMDDLDDVTVRERRQRVSNNRFVLKNLVSEDLNSLAIQIVAKVEAKDWEPILAAFQNESTSLGISKYVTAKAGGVADAIAQRRVSDENMYRLIPVIMLLGVVLLWWLYGKILPILLTLTVVGNSSLVATALVPAMGQPYCILTSMIAVILSAIGLAFIIHLFNAIAYASHRGLNTQESVDDGVKSVAWPSIFSSITTAVGLASLAVGELPPVKWFGIATAFGVLYQCFLTLVIAPILLRAFDSQKWGKKSGFRKLNRWISKLANIGLRNPVPIAFVTILFVVSLVPLIPQVTIETNVLKFFRQNHEIVKSTSRIEEKLSGISSVEIMLEAEPGRLKDLDVLKSMQKFKAWAISQPEVDFAMSHADIIEEMNWAFKGIREAERTLPTSQNLVDQYLLINSGETIWDFVDYDFSIARFPLRLNVHGSAKLGQIIERINAKLETEFAGEVRGSVQYEVLGFSRLFSELTGRIVSSQIASISTAALVIFFLMLISWRNFRASLVCMIPNLAPLTVAFASMVVFSIFIDFATSMFASLALGIAVDDTIHLYHSFRRYYDKSGNTVWALSRAYRHSGRAVLATTLILSLQYAVILSSSYLPFANFSFVMIVSLMTALVFDLILLPALLLMLFPTHKKAKEKGGGTSESRIPGAA